jgi:hypothetical protein
MKPGDHPDFFRFAPPPGTSRESTIRLDRDGTFFHDGQVVAHRALAKALASWIARHPDDGRFILTNGYDWTYFTVEDAPYVVASIDADAAPPTITLSDDSIEPLDPEGATVGDDGVVYVRVKGGAFEARLSRHAQTQLAPLLVGGDVEGAAPRLALGGREFPLPARARRC